MIVTCPNCSTSLQIDESKVSGERFTVRCPKCQNAIPVQLKANSNATTASTAPARNWERPSAATFQRNIDDGDISELNALNNAELLQLVVEVLKLKGNKTAAQASYQDSKRVLLCFGPERRESTAQLLDGAGYTVFLADDPAQVTEKIRDEEADTIVLSPEFAAKFNGANVVQQTVRMLLPSERRKIFVVMVEDSVQTYNTHEAFLRSINLVVNTSDLHHLPSILNRALRDFDELYRYFKHAVDSIN